MGPWESGQRALTGRRKNYDPPIPPRTDADENSTRRVEGRRPFASPETPPATYSIAEYDVESESFSSTIQDALDKLNGRSTVKNTYSTQATIPELPPTVAAVPPRYPKSPNRPSPETSPHIPNPDSSMPPPPIVQESLVEDEDRAATVVTPPASRAHMAVPRFNHRGYPVKSPGSSSTSSTPRSSKSPRPRSPKAPLSPKSRFRLDATPSSERLETIASPAIATVTEHPGSEEAKSEDSHYSNTGTSVLYNSADPRPASSIYDDVANHSSASLNTSETHQSMYTWETGLNEKGREVYTDFGINKRNGRRQLVSMLHDPQQWADIGPEEDDDLHNPEKYTKQTSVWGSLLTLRGITNLGCIIMLVVILLALFAGYPIITAYTSRPLDNFGAFNIGGVNASGQLPDVGPFALIDKDTPPEAYHHKSLETGETWELVFSDEFNREGRTFYPGDDPYWEAEDMHYWVTNNLEWYDPRQVTTRDGHLVITLTDTPSHGLNFTGGMMSTWNRFCFSGGYIETRVSLPGKSNIVGLWPAVWTLGNLGRVGYGGTLEGMWPYTYDACDRGTLRNQTLHGQPKFAPEYGDRWKDGDFNYLPGQRLSRCTCPESTMHPGPKHADGTWIGRSAPEIDIFEAQVDPDSLVGHVSQSGQWAPFNPGYVWPNTSDSEYHVYDRVMTAFNPFQGSVQQQATSALSITNQDCYTQETGCLSVYGFEYRAGYDGYISWINDGKRSWDIRGHAMRANEDAMVSARAVAPEPMYIIINLGLSYNFGEIDLDGLAALWPIEMWVDYIRVYQDPKKHNIGCDPVDYPTQEYIKLLGPAYTNPNITTYNQTIDNVPNLSWPKNSLIDKC